uniref:Uncharacterized protein n=1 Tax=Oryza barthii TaxID=65489 RepID=A0A0D3H7B5_9ORYZ
MAVGAKAEAGPSAVVVRVEVGAATPKADSTGEVEEASYGWFNVGTDGAGVRADWLATYRARTASVLVGSNNLYNRRLSLSHVVAATGSPRCRPPTPSSPLNSHIPFFRAVVAGR